VSAEMHVNGRWLPAIPEPYYWRVRKQCVCGAMVWTRAGYREHYVLTHVYAERETPPSGTGRKAP
jgi:hypothetical protein